MIAGSPQQAVHDGGDDCQPHCGAFYFIKLSKTSQFKTVCKDDSGYITQLKQQKSKR